MQKTQQEATKAEHQAEGRQHRRDRQQHPAGPLREAPRGAPRSGPAARLDLEDEHRSQHSHQAGHGAEKHEGAQGTLPVRGGHDRGGGQKEEIGPGGRGIGARGGQEAPD